MDTDIRDELERCFGEGPTPPPADLILDRGRRALRRRRLAEAGSALAVAAVFVGAVALAGAGSTPDATPGPAGPAASGRVIATDTATPTPSAVGADFPPPPGAPPVRDSRMPAGWAVGLEPDGLHVGRGVRVLQVVDDPWRLRPDGEWSVGVRYRDRQGVLNWWAGYIDRGFGGASAGIPAGQAGDVDFATWVAEQKAGVHVPARGEKASGDSPTPDGGWPGMTDLQLVRFAGDGERLTPLDAVTLLTQRPHPALPKSWALAGDRSAAAEVSFEGRRYYVLARWVDGDVAPQYIAVRADRGGATLDDFLGLARQRYAEGGGGLL